MLEESQLEPPRHLAPAPATAVLEAVASRPVEAKKRVPTWPTQCRPKLGRAPQTRRFEAGSASSPSPALGETLNPRIYKAPWTWPHYITYVSVSKPQLH